MTKLGAEEKEPFFRKGLKFESQHFTDKGEVSEIRESVNEVDVILTTSENHGRKVTWSLSEVKGYFDSNIYREIKKDSFNLSVY